MIQSFKPLMHLGLFGHRGPAPGFPIWAHSEGLILREPASNPIWNRLILGYLA